MGDGVGNGLEYDDAAKPPVHQVVRVKGDTKERDEGVVPSSKEEEWYLISQGVSFIHVDYRQPKGQRGGMRRTMLTTDRAPVRFLRARVTSSQEPE